MDIAVQLYQTDYSTIALMLVVNNLEFMSSSHKAPTCGGRNLEATTATDEAKLGLGKLEPIKAAANRGLCFVCCMSLIILTRNVQGNRKELLALKLSPFSYPFRPFKCCVLSEL